MFRVLIFRKPYYKTDSSLNIPLILSWRHYIMINRNKCVSHIHMCVHKERNVKINRNKYLDFFSYQNDILDELDSRNNSQGVWLGFAKCPSFLFYRNTFQINFLLVFFNDILIILYLIIFVVLGKVY